MDVEHLNKTMYDVLLYMYVQTNGGCTATHTQAHTQMTLCQVLCIK